MPKIKWIGFFKEDIAQYQMNEMTGIAHKMKLPDSMNELMIKALPFVGFPIVLLFVTMFVKVSRTKQIGISPFFLAIGILLGMIGLIAHEYLHAIAFPKDAICYIGVKLDKLIPVTLASYPLKRSRFILMSLFPYLLGIIPFTMFCVLPSKYIVVNSICYGFSYMGLISPYPDAYNVCQVIKQTPRSCKIQIYGDDTYWIENERGQ